jgi:hypothetical protein
MPLTDTQIRNAKPGLRPVRQSGEGEKGRLHHVEAVAMAVDFSRWKARPSRGGPDFGRCSFQRIGTSKPWAISRSVSSN